MARKGKTAKRPMTMRKAKAMVGKSHKKAAKKNMDTFFFKAKVMATITPTQGGSVANYISQWIPLVDAVSPIGCVKNTEFNLYNTLYDQVRINSVKVTVTPKANVLDQRQAQNDTELNTGGDGLIHHCIDADGPPPASIPRVMRYPSYRKTSVLKPFTRTYSVKYPTSVWLDCQSIFADVTLLNRLGLAGGIYIYAENVLEDNGEVFNEPWATLSVEYNCVFRGKTSSSLQYDPTTGEVLLRPTPLGQIIPNSPMTVLYGTYDADKTTDQYGSYLPRASDDVVP